MPDLKYDQKLFIRIPSLNLQEMRPWGTFYLIFSNGYHGNNECYKNFDFSFRYVFPSSMTVKNVYLSSSGREKIYQSSNFSNFLYPTALMKNTLNCEETQGNSLWNSVLHLITRNLNHCQALYRFSNKSYNENQTNFAENFTYPVVDAIVFTIIFQVLFCIPWYK